LGPAGTLDGGGRHGGRRDGCGVGLVSCSSQLARTAVGYSKNAAGTGLTLAERWNGERWSIQPTLDSPGELAAASRDVDLIDEQEDQDALPDPRYQAIREHTYQNMMRVMKHAGSGSLRGKTVRITSGFWPGVL
jgi:hypothetical protein